MTRDQRKAVDDARVMLAAIDGILRTKKVLFVEKSKAHRVLKGIRKKLDREFKFRPLPPQPL